MEDEAVEHEAVNCVVEVDVLCCCHAVCGVVFCFMLNMYTHSHSLYSTMTTSLLCDSPPATATTRSRPIDSPGA